MSMWSVCWRSQCPNIELESLTQAKSSGSGSCPSLRRSSHFNFGGPSSLHACLPQRDATKDPITLALRRMDASPQTRTETKGGQRHARAAWGSGMLQTPSRHKGRNAGGIT